MAQVSRGRRSLRFLTLAAASGVYFGGGTQAAHGLLSHDRWSWTDMAVAGGTWGVLWLPASMLGAAFARRGVERGWVHPTPARQREDQYEELVGPALETGTLPAGADPGVWGPALRNRARDATIVRWVISVVLLVTATLVGTAAVVENDNAWGVWIVAAVVFAEAVAAARLLGRRVDAVDRLQRQLH